MVTVGPSSALDAGPNVADPWLEHLAIDYDEDLAWIVLSRGRFRIACNLSTEPVTVPVSGEVALAWGAPIVNADSTELAGHSVAVLRGA